MLQEERYATEGERLAQHTNTRDDGEMDILVPHLKQLLRGYSNNLLLRKSGLFVPLKINKDVLNHRYDRTLLLYANHRMLLGVVARIHCFLEIILEKNNLPITKEGAESIKKSINENIYIDLRSQENNTGRVYDITRGIVEKEMQISALSVVGLFHQQEKRLKILLKERKEFFFSNEILTKNKNKNKRIYCIELFSDMAKKFNMPENGDLFQTIKEGNAFVNAAKHGDTENLNKFYNEKSKKCLKKCVETAILINSPDEVFLWRDLLVKYAKALEEFWLHVFENLEKPSNEDSKVYFFEHQESQVDFSIFLKQTREAMNDCVAKFWKDIERKYGVKPDEGNFKCSCT